MMPAAHSNLRARAPAATPRDMPITTWAGQSVNPIGEPWLRFSKVIRTMRPFVERIPANRIGWLDVGCQAGQFVSVVRAAFPQAECAGVDDFAPENTVEVCAKYLRTIITHPDDVLAGWSYTQRQIDRQGFALGRKFHVISALEVIEHIVDTDLFAQECADHLNKGGFLVISTPNINSLRNRASVPFGYYPVGLEYRTVVHHVRLFNLSVLTSHIEKFGFERVSAQGVSFLRFNWLKHSFTRRLDDRLSGALPYLCNNLLVVFRKR